MFKPRILIAIRAIRNPFLSSVWDDWLRGKEANFENFPQIASEKKTEGRYKKGFDIKSKNNSCADTLGIWQAKSVPNPELMDIM